MVSLPFVVAISITTAGANTLRGSNGVNPVTRVVRLLQEMKAQVESEAKEDEDIHSEHGCWCDVNEKEKTAAIKNAHSRIEQLTATIEEGTARSAQLETEIGSLKDEISQNQEALEKASAMREQEREEFETDANDAMEAITALKQAVQVLSKVQFMQKQKSNFSASNDMLLQVRDLVKPIPVRSSDPTLYKSVLQRDLWDMLGSLPGGAETRVVTGLVEQPSGNAAGASSYNAQSSQILGMLQEMKAEFERDLAASQKAELHAEVSFQKLKSAKMAEIMAAGKSLEEKSAELADTNERVAQAKEDIDETRGALATDEKFLVDLKSRCADADEEFAARKKTRNDEMLAIAETIKILTSDESRDLFSSTVSFLQLKSRRIAAAGNVERTQAASELLQTAKKFSGTTGGWQLATLAVSMQLDNFSKVKSMMDKMIEELKKQQTEEVAKHDSCSVDLNENEGAMRAKDDEKNDLIASVTDLEASISQLSADIEDLKLQIQNLHISLKRASEDRSAQNKEFQQVVADQRATVAILNKALDRLKQFYNNPSLLQRQARQEPGAPVNPPPATGKRYSEAGGATGVMSTIEMIIQEAKAADEEAVRAEQNAQSAYSELVSNTNSMLENGQSAITEKTATQARNEADKIADNKDLKATIITLEDLHGINTALHQNCDYVVRNFNIRQAARQEEIEAIQEAKAILSGADFS